jgi:molecular chaperone DnaK
MKHFVGIDLGTTNSAICVYDGENVRILKSPDQNDVTPSAILIDRRGNKYIGKRAYDAAPGNPDNAALLFKRLMGSSTQIHFASAKTDKSPEECSAEVLKVLFGYLPEEIRNSQDVGTVITVPAAFNQMQKDATVQAAHMAGIGRVALMQEPVAAVMSVMRTRKNDGTFLIYDFGGGTLDVAIAESLGGRVNLLANGGIQMCGGRDMDRAIFDNIVKPWLMDNFELPTDFMTNAQYKRLIRYANWAIERAKIELSSREEANISLSEVETGTRDESGEEIYLDITITREEFNPLIEEKIMESVNAVRETLSKAGLNADDIEKIVFIGGPTNYKPLRDKVCFELGIAGSTDVNPMTAVSEGASLFAESIDWSTQDNARKSSRGRITSKGSLKLSFAYTARTPEYQAKIVAQIQGKVDEGTEFQIDSLDSGWTSGRIALTNGAIQNLPLSKNGDNVFKVFVFDPAGGAIDLGEDKIIIHRTAATVDAIPASHSIGIAVREKAGGAQTLEWLVRAGDSLPQKGTLTFKAAETLKAGSSSTLNFNLWEGEILDPITDNRLIGSLKIKGTDFDEGIIPAGAELICDYEMLDSGAICLEVSVPSIGATFPSDRNFYSRQDGQIDFAAAGEQVRQDSEDLEERIADIENRGVDDPKLEEVKNKIARAKELSEEGADIESTQEAQEKLLEVKKVLAQVRKDHIREIRQMELDSCVDFFDSHVREYAKQSESDSFDALHRTAKHNIARNSRDFEENLDEMRGYNFTILWRQDWFVIDSFKRFIKDPQAYSDPAQFDALVQQGTNYIKNDDIAQLRRVIAQLMQIRIYKSGVDDIMADVNILRG